MVASPGEDGEVVWGSIGGLFSSSTRVGRDLILLHTIILSLGSPLIKLVKALYVPYLILIVVTKIIKIIYVGYQEISFQVSALALDDISHRVTLSSWVLVVTWQKCLNFGLLQVRQCYDFQSTCS